MKFIIGRKVGMTRVYDEDGRNFAVTKVKALPCEIGQIKDKQINGYKSVVVKAYKDADKKKVVKVSEFREENLKKYKTADAVLASQFKKNDAVTVEGTAKGKGFAGTIKRHGFHRGPASHGSKNVRKPGSIGGGYPQRVVAGKKMAGRMGGDNVTIKNLRIIDVLDDILLISGAIPGPNKSFVKVYGSGEKAEEIVDHAAEEELLAQQKMLEADAERKESAANDDQAVAQPKTDSESSESQITNDKPQTEEKVEEEKSE